MHHDPLISSKAKALTSWGHDWVVAWFECEGNRYVQFPNRPSYPSKEEPSFADMLTTLRRRSWENKLRDLLPKSGRLKKQVTEIIRFLSLAG